MSANNKRITISLLIYILWIIITMFGARLIAGGEVALNDLVSKGIGWHFAIAIGLLLVSILVFKWNDMHFNRPHALIRVMWFPSIYLVFYAAALTYFGSPPLSVVMFVGINTLMVGISEELMFRGVLFRAFEKAMAIWPAIILSSVLFGAVHSLNVFITGELGQSLLQSIAAGMSGLVFIAIVIRSGSIWPAIVYHFLWDFLLFLVSNQAGQGNVDTHAEASNLAMLFPIFLNLPNVIFALLLLRGVGKKQL